MGSTCISRFICDYYFGTCMETLRNVASIREPCEHISSIQIAPLYLYIFIMYPNWQFTLKYGIFLKNLDSTAFEATMSYIYPRKWHSDDTTLSSATKHVLINKEGEQYPLGLGGLKCKMLLCGYETNDPTGCQREVCAWHEVGGNHVALLVFSLVGHREITVLCICKNLQPQRAFVLWLAPVIWERIQGFNVCWPECPHFKFKRCQKQNQISH